MTVPTWTTLLLLLVTVSCAQQSKKADSFVLKKVNSVFTTESRWLTSFVVNNEPFIQNVQSIQDDANSLLGVLNHYIEQLRDAQDPNNSYHLDIFRTYRTKIKIINKETSKMIVNAKQIQDFLIESPNRSRRSLLPFLGDFLSGLTGVATQKDIDAINEHLQIMYSQNDELSHILDGSISVINATKIQLDNVIDTVNDLNDLTAKLNHELQNVTLLTFRTVNDLKRFQADYFDIDVHEQLLQANLRLLQQQLLKFKLIVSDALQGKVTPLLVEPTKFKEILQDIQDKIDPRFQMPFEIKTELMKYYQYLTCDVFHSPHGFGIVLSIPLVSIESKFDIYEVVNVPVPYTNTSFLFMYDVSQKYIAISYDRTKFVYLTSTEFNKCSNVHSRFCHITSVSRFVSRHLSSCIVEKLYSHTMKNCNAKFVSDSIVLPQAFNLNYGNWLIITQQPQTFTVMCKNSSLMKTVTPPTAHLHVPIGCTAQSQSLRIPPTFYQHSDISLIVPLHLYTSNVSVLDIVPTTINSELLHRPEKIKRLLKTTTSLADLAQHLRNSRYPAHHVELSSRNSLLVKVLPSVSVAMSLIVIVSIVAYCYYDRCSRLVTTRQSVSRQSDSSPGSTVTPEFVAMPIPRSSQSLWTPPVSV